MNQLILGGILLALVGGYVWHCEAQKREYSVFLNETRRQGKEAKASADKKIAAYQAAKEKSDAENKALRAGNAALDLKLRGERAARGYLPPATPGAQRPDRASFDRAELGGALRRLDERVSGLIGEGDASRIDLDTARRWAQELQRDRIAP